MDEWGPRTFGDPCRACGYSWAITEAGAIAWVADLPNALVAVLGDASGYERLPELEWTVTAYVAHVGDNLRIWAERLVGITAGGPPAVIAYDENALATVRRYDALSLAGVVWSLDRAVHDWLDAVRAAPADLTMAHPERGELGRAQVVRTNAHDAAHHLWDIERILDATSCGRARR